LKKAFSTYTYQQALVLSFKMSFPKCFVISNLLRTKFWLPNRARVFSNDCTTIGTNDKEEEALFGKHKKFQFPSVVEQKINEQIGHELYVSHVCLSMAQYFCNTDHCLNGFARHFRRMSDEERRHALMLCDFQNMRGGCVKLEKLEEPPKCEFQTLCDPYMCLLELEHGMTDRLYKLMDCAFQQRDYATALFIADKFIPEQVMT
jgi:ferritin